MDIKLSTQAIKDILSGEGIHEPLLQVLKIKEIALSAHSSTFRALLSDGRYVTNNALFYSQLSEFARTIIDKNAVIKLNRYITADSYGKKIIVILEASLVDEENENLIDIIGDPVLLDSSGQNTHLHIRTEKVAAGTLSTPNSKTPDFSPISSLRPYQYEWTICARVTYKTDIKHFCNDTEGVVFNVHLLDQSGEIRAVAFDEECNRLHSFFEENSSYYITGGRIKCADKRYSPMKNDFEISFNSETTVIPCYHDFDIPSLEYDFIPLSSLFNLQNDELVDAIGVCISYDGLSTVHHGISGREYIKRDITIMDDSNTMVCVTFWGSQAEKFDGSSNPVIAFKHVKVTDYHGKSLSILWTSTVQINPDIKEAHELRHWYMTREASII